MFVWLALILGSTPANAADGWNLDALFPERPCADGWVGCMVSGHRVDPEPSPDETGAPMPSDLRVSWFTLKGTSAFDPFTKLSEYPVQARVAVMVPQPEAAPDPIVPEPAQPVVRPAASMTEPRRPNNPPPQAHTTAPEPESATTPPPQIGLIKKEPTECGPTADYQRKSMLGKLTAEDQACLEAITSATKSRATLRSKTSRIQIANAFAKGDNAEWARLMKRHLDEIERSDANIAFAYAKHLERKGHTESVLFWAGIALDNRTQWTGEDYMRRTLALRSMRARAAGKRWQKLAEANAENGVVDDGDTEKWRVITVTESREWYDTAIAMGKPSNLALALCQSASGTDDACR
ncbi:MAG: hypothetical protein AB8H79_01405 [Myxococcota bacterium]